MVVDGARSRQRLADGSGCQDATVPSVQTYGAGRFDLATVLEAKGARRVAVCVPARDEARTIGSLIEAAVLGHLGPHGSGLVDELVVVDDGSADATAAIARAAGATVVNRRPGGDKGAAMAAGLEASRGDVVVFLDADVENADSAYVPQLVGPLLTERAVLVKGYYERPYLGRPTGGGRVTEKVGFAPGYGVEIGHLIDVARAFGAEAIAQVDLGIRVHRNRPLDELRPQADDVLRAALRRAGTPGLS